MKPFVRSETSETTETPRKVIQPTRVGGFFLWRGTVQREVGGEMGTQAGSVHCTQHTHTHTHSTHTHTHTHSASNRQSLSASRGANPLFFVVPCVVRQIFCYSNMQVTKLLAHTRPHAVFTQSSNYLQNLVHTTHAKHERQNHERCSGDTPEKTQRDYLPLLAIF